MIEFKKKIKVKPYTPQAMMPNKVYAQHYKLGYQEYDLYGKMWEVGEDVNFDKFWFREVK